MYSATFKSPHLEQHTAKFLNGFAAFWSFAAPNAPQINIHYSPRINQRVHMFLDT